MEKSDIPHAPRRAVRNVQKATKASQKTEKPPMADAAPAAPRSGITIVTTSPSFSARMREKRGGVRSTCPSTAAGRSGASPCR